MPAGFGTLRQEDVSVNVQLLGVAVRALPLDESVLRVLSPDSYRALRDLARSRQGAIDAVARRYGVVRPALWYVQFFGVQQGEARFSPLDVVISSAGRDFRPLDVVSVTPGFGEGRIMQRQTQAAIYVFDGGLDPNQPLTFSFQTARDDSWATTLRRIESERTLARARAAAASGTRTDSTRRTPR
ncbi:MAG TPA: hypothetical protein VFY16_10930 [Gemmatimonadaceae bacterium]|nr:hypothetical protein [Gemmatimonadaceae bacterium]